MKGKLAVFDFDSTLMDGESINLVLNQVLSNPVQKQALEELRAKGMRGEIDLQTTLIQRIKVLKGLEIETLNNICQQFLWIKGAQQTLSALKKSGYTTVCFSGSFRTAPRRVMTELNMDAYASNTLEIKNGKLTGKIKGDLMHHDSKGILLNKLQKELSVMPENTIVIGDGANDLSMFAYADIKIAFCAQDVLKEQATHIIDSKDLSTIMSILKKSTC